MTGLRADFDNLSFLTGTDSTVSGLPGAGRTVDALLGRAGRRVESVLGSMGERLGRGPTQAVARMLAVVASRRQLAVNDAVIWPKPTFRDVLGALLAMAWPNPYVLCNLMLGEGTARTMEMECAQLVHFLGPTFHPDTQLLSACYICLLSCLDIRFHCLFLNLGTINALKDLVDTPSLGRVKQPSYHIDSLFSAIQVLQHGPYGNLCHFYQSAAPVVEPSNLVQLIRSLDTQLEGIICWASACRHIKTMNAFEMSLATTEVWSTVAVSEHIFFTSIASMLLVRGYGFVRSSVWPKLGSASEIRDFWAPMLQAMHNYEDRLQHIPMLTTVARQMLSPLESLPMFLRPCVQFSPRTKFPALPPRTAFPPWTDFWAWNDFPLLIQFIAVTVSTAVYREPPDMETDTWHDALDAILRPYEISEEDERQEDAWISDGFGHTITAATYGSDADLQSYQTAESSTSRPQARDLLLMFALELPGENQPLGNGSHSAPARRQGAETVFTGSGRKSSSSLTANKCDMPETRPEQSRIGEIPTFGSPSDESSSNATFLTVEERGPAGMNLRTQSARFSTICEEEDYTDNTSLEPIPPFSVYEEDTNGAITAELVSDDPAYIPSPTSGASSEISLYGPEHDVLRWL